MNHSVNAFTVLIECQVHPANGRNGMWPAIWSLAALLTLSLLAQAQQAASTATQTSPYAPSIRALIA